MSKYVYQLELDRPETTATAIYHAVRQGGPRVLDIGSGPGIIASFLVRDAGKDVTCVDFDADALDSAREQGVQTTHVVDLRDEQWWAPLSGQQYDVVVLADVLEHLVDPERILTDITAQKLLADDGRLVLSVPNANHEAVVTELVTGHFRYTDTGLLDRTHLRFFTFESMSTLLECNGFFVTAVHRTPMPLASTRQRHRAPEVTPELRAALDRMGPESRTFQYVLTVRPGTEAARLAELQDQVEEMRTRVHAADVKRVAADRTAARDRALREEATARTAELTAEVERLRSKVAALRAKIEEMRSSTTWRLGTRATRTLRRVRPGTTAR